MCVCYIGSVFPVEFVLFRLLMFFFLLICFCVGFFLNRDWYNLEKSKRVKPFRCGEFDACIERAESAHGMPLKKREKYARREDAILHALELEKQMLKKQEKSGIASDSTNFMPYCIIMLRRV